MRNSVVASRKTLFVLLAIHSLSVSSWAAGYRDAVMADGPIAYWRFNNEAPPTAVNSGTLGAAANGTYNGDAVPGAQAPRPPGFVGFESDNTAAQFDGAGDWVGTLGNLLNSKPVFTISGWMRRNGDQPGRTGLWGQNDIVEFGYIANQTLEVWTDNGLDIVNAIPNGEWAHLAIVSDGNPGTMFMYTNGVLAGSRAHSLPPNNAFEFNIGGGGIFDALAANPNPFNGQIDEVAIFTTALSASRIAAQHAAASEPITPLPKFAQLGRNRIGSATNNGAGSFTIVGGGNDIWDNVDEFTYQYTEVTGDFDVKVRVESLQPSARWTKAGLMVRETLAEDSRKIFNRVTPLPVPTVGGDGANDTRLAYRTGRHEPTAAFGDDHNGGRHEDIDAANTIPAANMPNGWLRLVRRGPVFFASNSTDGVSWQFVSSQDTSAGDWVFSPNNAGPFANTVLLGLGVSRHSGSPTATAEFRDFALTFGTAGSFNVLDASSRGNPTGVRVGFNSPPGAGAGTAANYTIGVVSGPNVTAPVTGVRFITGNDAPERDPMTFTLEGTMGTPASGPWTLIASGNTGFAVDPGRNVTGPIVSFANANGYTHYRVLFPTVRNEATANSMQIAEIDLLDAGGNDITTPGDAVLGVVAIAGSSASAVAVEGTAANVNNYPAAEPPAEAIDNVPVPPGGGAKYLNFAKVNTGIIVSPSSAALPSDPTVLAAAAGPNPNTVQLTTSRLVEGANYILTVANVLGADGTGLGNVSANFVHGAGYEHRNIRLARNMIPGASLDLYLNSLAYQQDIPTASTDLPAVASNTLFEDVTPVTGDGREENYSMRISGVLVAPTTGNYRFYMSSDDNGILFLSSDANPANKVQIAREPEWNGARQYLVTDRRPGQENISALQTLQAGQRYYLELIYSEGGGGNFGSAAWQPPGGPAVANGSLPIPESAFTPTRQFGGSVFLNLGSVQITTQPASQSVTALTPATFRVNVDGTPRYTYQWRRNNQPIAGATAPNYTIPAAQLSDDQSRYSVVVANEFSSATSADAVLSVLNPVPPHLLGASASSFTSVRALFDNRVETASAQNVANYSITNAAGTVVAISGAARDATARGVVLTTATPLAPDTLYTLTVANVRDETGTTTMEPSPTNAVFTTLAFIAGSVMREFYPQFSGTAVDAMITAVRAGTVMPTKACLTNLYEYNDADVGLQGGQADNYGGRIYGYFVPTTSGDHTFYFASDDPGRLFLSTDANPANIREISREPVWSGRRTWDGEAGGGGRVGVPSASGGPQINISGPINLNAGERYYIESFFTEGGGGDNMAVAVQGPGEPAPVAGSTPITSANLAVAFSAGTLAITAQPQGQTNTENSFVTFSVTVASSSVLCGGPSIQWYSNGVAVAGANGPSIIVGPLALTDDGNIYHAVVTSPERSVTSSNAVLGVIGDTVPPVLLSASADATFTNIFLTWSEIMAAGPASADNFLLLDSSMNQIFVNSVDFLGSSYVLRLQTPLLSGGVYSLEIDYQTDFAGNPTMKVGNPTVDTTSGIVTNVSAWVEGCPALVWESYPSGAGNAVSVLTSHPSYPNNPDGRRIMATFDTRAELGTDNFREGFGARLRGLFVPPTSGNWVFYLHSDDAAELWLNPNGANPAGRTKIVEELGCCRDWPAVFSAGIPLTGGRAYYIEALYQEGTGGDYVRVAARLAGSTAPLAAIGPDQLGRFAPAGVAGTLTISQQPTNTSVPQNSTAIFTVGTQTEFPMNVCYQWQRGDGAGGFTNIPGATASSYSLVGTAADNGAIFRVAATIVGATALSSNAVLTVVADTGAPVLLSARADQTFNRINLRWSEIMAQGPAIDGGNFILRDSGNNRIDVTSVDYLGSNFVLNLLSPLMLGGVYTLEIDYQEDLVGNRTAPIGNPTVDTVGGIVTNVYAFVASSGFVLKELYMGLSASTVVISDLRASPKYPNSPDIVRHGELLELNTFDEFEGYGARLRGWLVPPVSGNYTFYIAADDNGELWLSTDANPANIVNIANEPVWSGRRTWVGEAGGGGRVGVASPSGGPQANISGPISMVAGQMYYFEALVKEGGGGDNLAVAWRIPGGPAPVNGSSPIEGKDIVAIADPFGASVTITQQPAPLTLFSRFAAGTPLASVDFNANNGGFTVTTPQAYDGPWVYNAATGSWRQDGQQPDNGHPNTSLLESPAIPITVAGQVGLSFTHRYSFEQDTVNWDGGQVRVSVNGGPFTAIPGSAFTANGYNGSVGASASLLAGQQAFVGTTPGYTSGATLNGFVTSVASLGNFNAGDTVRVQFMAASDTNTRGPIVPNWEIDSGALTQGGQFNVALTVGAATTVAPGVNNLVTYQWQRNEGGVWQDVFRPSARSATLTFIPALGSVYDYRVLVCIPGAAATSTSATVVGLIVFPWNGTPEVLQRSTLLPGNWTDILNAPNPYVIDPRNPPQAGAPMLPQEFFRQRPPAP